jgi:hypothetical protein
MQINPQKKYRVSNRSDDRGLSKKDQQLCLPGKFSGRPPLKAGQSTILKGDEINQNLFEIASNFGKSGFWVQIEEYVPGSSIISKDTSKEKPPAMTLEAKSRKVVETIEEKKEVVEDRQSPVVSEPVSETKENSEEIEDIPNGGYVEMEEKQQEAPFDEEEDGEKQADFSGEVPERRVVIENGVRKIKRVVRKQQVV